LLSRAHCPPFEALLTALINEITALPGPLVLVLDDYHCIQAQAIHDTLAYLLDHLPPHAHLAIATRANPPLPVARLRGRGQVSELRQADLRFEPDQVAALLRLTSDLDLGSEDVAALTARTEGWIAGLQLAALSMQGRQDLSGFVANLTGSHEYIADYLGDEVLGRQSERVRTFLLHTSILDRLTGPLCDAVSGQDGGHQTLHKLKGANLFLVSLEDERRWYRYHHLFASLLRQRLQQTQPDIVPELHRRASAWYEQTHLIAGAVEHGLIAQDLDRVEQLVAEQALTMIYYGELTILKRWLETVPHRVVRSRPWLCIATAWVLIYGGQSDAAEPLLQDAERASRDVDERVERQHIAGHIAAIRAYVSARNRKLAHSLTLIREALAYLPEDELMVRSLTQALAGDVLRMSGDLKAAAQSTAEAITLAQAAGADYIAVDARCDLATLQMAQGQLHDAAATARDALRLARGLVGQGGGSLPIVGLASARLSLVLYQWNDLEAALHHARRGLEASKRWGQTAYLGLAYGTMALVLQAMGDTAGALDTIQQAVQMATALSPSITAMLTAIEMQIRLLQGDTASALRWARSSGLRVNDELAFYRYQEYRAFAQTLIALGEWNDARVLLARLLEMAQVTGAGKCEIEVLVLQAIPLRAQDRSEQALAALERALTLAEPKDYVRAFIDHRAPMGQLLRQASARGIATNYTNPLLAALEAEVDRTGREIDGRDPWAVRGQPVHRPSSFVDPLSARELEVLRLLPTYRSRREIADHLKQSSPPHENPTLVHFYGFFDRYQTWV
jgi:LuxR family maltose regulon positive regulatory protein